MKKLCCVVLAVAGTAICLAGCNNGPKSMETAPRADQERAMRGDPAKIEEMNRQMAQKYGAGQPGGAPPQAAQPGAPR